MSGLPLFGDEDYWEQECSLIDKVMVKLMEGRLTEAEFREVARTEPWRSVWNSYKFEGCSFGCSPCDYTDDQKVLANWSSLYDNIYQNPDAPPEDVINDDDLLDGWLILQRRERGKGISKEEEVDANSKIRNSDEVFVVAETTEDARKVVEGLNDAHGIAVQKQKFAYIKDKGEVAEAELPDVKQKLRLQSTQRLSQAMKGK
jgi:hypothetical protein